MYYTPKEEKIIETALYVYAHSGPSYSMRDAIDSITQMRNAVKDLLNIRHKNMSVFVENPLGALTYIAEQTGLEIDFGKNEISYNERINVFWNGIQMKAIRLFFKDGKFHYYRFYEHYDSFIDLTSSEIETVIKIIKMDKERYLDEYKKPWFDSFYATKFNEPWWKK